MARPFLLSILLIAVLAPVAGGASATTTAPDPVTATVLADDALPVVRACFDSNVSSAVAGGFTVVDYDSAQRVAGASVRSITTPSTCVDVVFPDGTAVGQDSLLEFAAAAAQAGGILSAPGVAPLAGSTLAARPGGTQAPDLMSAAVDPNDATHVVYTFDEALDPALAATGAAADPTLGADPAHFVAYDPMGRPQTATSVVGVNGATITVQFAAGATTGATRFVALAGAVRDRRCAAGAAACGTATDWDASPPGQAGAAPAGLNTLLSATPDTTGSAIDLRWSAAVTPAAAGTIRFYREDGRPATGTLTVTQLDPQVLHVTLGADVADPGAIVVAGVDGPAYGAVPVRAGGQAPGYTDGPDLIATVRTGTTVTYTFDAPLADDVSRMSVRVLLSDGSAQLGVQNSAGSDGRALSAIFSSFPAPVVAGIVLPGGVYDAAGDAAPLSVAVPASAGATPVPTATATASAAPTAAPTVAPAATSTPMVTAAPTKAKRKHAVGAMLTTLVRHNKRVSGLVLAAAPCQKDRKIVASAGGRKLGSTRTKKHGVFSVKSRRLVASRIKITLKKRVYKRKKVTIVCQSVSLKV